MTCNLHHHFHYAEPLNALGDGKYNFVPGNTERMNTPYGAYTNTDTTGYQIDKYDPNTLYLIT